MAATDPVDSWLIVALIAAIALALYQTYRSGAPQRQTAPPLRQSTPRTIAGAPNGTPLKLADAMRLAADQLVPRLSGSGTVSVPSADVARSAVQEVLKRLNANGAGLTDVATPVAEAKQIVDEFGTTALRVSFLAYDRVRNFASKLKAIVIAPADRRIYVQSVKFATAAQPLDQGPRAFEEGGELARYLKPEEVLREMDLGPGARVQY